MSRKCLRPKTPNELLLKPSTPLNASELAARNVNTQMTDGRELGWLKGGVWPELQTDLKLIGQGTG